MNRFVASLVLPAFLLACGSGSNPFEGEPEPPVEGETPQTPVANGIPEAISGDLTSLSFDTGTQTLTVEGITLDDVPFLATYRRTASLDRGGYFAFTAQDDPLDRHNTAFVRQSGNGGDVRAGIAVSGGPRNRFFGGGYYERDGDYTPPIVTPNSGLVSYSGSYVGLVNVGFRDDGPGSLDDLAAVPPGTPLELIPDQAGIVEGNIFINADFADGSVEGNIIDRVLINPSTETIAQTPGGAPLILPSIVLISTPINDQGGFAGDVEYEQRDPSITVNVIGSSIGDYGGIFGGDNAEGVAGAVHLDEWDGPNNPFGLENEEEYGVFVLDQCGTPAENVGGCAGTNP